MSVTDKHFRTDGKRIEPCCDDMDSMLVFGFPNQYFTFLKDGRLYLRMSDGDCYPCTHCPCCGAELEHVEYLDSKEAYE